ncbi:MAG: hypothetical protein ABSG89_10740 [Bacteroidales bacterium]|jgi:hypothetical protein
MKPEDLKKLIIQSLDNDADPKDIAGKLEGERLFYDFSQGFKEKVIDRLFSASHSVIKEVELVRDLNFIFKRIAVTGIAAIIILTISIFLMQGSFSLNSLFGLSNDYNESIICMLTGK